MCIHCGWSGKTVPELAGHESSAGHKSQLESQLPPGRLNHFEQSLWWLGLSLASCEMKQYGGPKGLILTEGLITGLQYTSERAYC